MAYQSGVATHFELNELNDLAAQSISTTNSLTTLEGEEDTAMIWTTIDADEGVQDIERVQDIDSSSGNSSSSVDSDQRYHRRKSKKQQRLINYFYLKKRKYYN